MNDLRVALVHDWLTGQRGGEKVLEVLAEIFPRAPIYTLFRIPGTQVEAIERRDIRTSFVQRLPFVRSRYRWYLPLFPLAAESFDLSGYDLVVSSSHCAAKGIIPAPGAVHVSYVHSPVRYAWNQYAAYFGPGRLGPFSRWLVPPLVHYIRMWDVASSARVDAFIANSAAVAERIRRYYRRPAEVVHPPVDTDFFRPSEAEPSRGYFLVVSALVPYKRLDLAIAAFNRARLPLKIVGGGPEEARLRRLAGPTVSFLGPVGGADLRRLYQEARAYVLPGEEDFGIAALEAQACGTPVIAFGRGGALETVKPGETGLFFPEPSAESLLAALDKFATLAFNRQALRFQAESFARIPFKDKLSGSILRAWREAQDRT